MSRPVSILLTALLVTSPASAQPSADDARAVIAAVLAHQAALRGPEGGAQTCVVGALAGPPAKAGEDDVLVPEFAVRIGFQWHQPESAAVARPPPPPPAPGRRRERRRPEPIPLPPALDPALAARLDAQRAEAVPGPALRGIDAALVPPPLQLQGPNGDCAPLTLSDPAFAGDTAFVALAYACGTTCGNGSLYALQRRDGGWQPVGVADIWIR
jgi:hypothetical protein